jgi:hypothetical protein
MFTSSRFLGLTRAAKANGGAARPPSSFRLFGRDLDGIETATIFIANAHGKPGPIPYQAGVIAQIVPGEHHGFNTGSVGIFELDANIVLVVIMIGEIKIISGHNDLHLRRMNQNERRTKRFALVDCTGLAFLAKMQIARVEIRYASKTIPVVYPHLSLATDDDAVLFQ